MKTTKITTDKKRFMQLLLLADEQESMIDRYLERGDMFVMQTSVEEAVCSAVVTDEGDGVCELKNLAVAPQHQRKGYGRKMIDFLLSHYAETFKTMIVGTGDSTQTVSFYKSCGFRYSHTVPDFFTDNYDHPIIEDGKVLKDMIYFSKSLAKTVIVNANERTDDVITPLVRLWERSVRASHHFLKESDIVNFTPLVYEYIKAIGTLIVLYHDKKPAGFIGLEGRKIEMLFISPDYFGQGFGKQLAGIAINDYGCVFVDVNEQNPEAEKFYRHIGFRTFERTETDEQGNPFPILRMKLN